MLTFLGMMLFFERNLLRIGNLLIVGGITVLIGPTRVQSFFFQRQRTQAAIITLIGLYFVDAGNISHSVYRFNVGPFWAP
jgi:hypothetical protein